MRVCVLYVRRNVMHLNGKQYAKANGNNQSSVWWWRRNRISAQTPQSHLLHFIVSDARTDTHTHVTEHISDEMRPTTWNALCVRCSSNLSFCSNAFSTKCFNEEFPSWLLAITVGIVSLIAVSMLVFDVPFVGCPSGVHFSCVPYLVLQANCKYSKFYLQMNTSGGESTLVSLSNVAFKAETLRLLRGTFQIIRRHQCGPDFRIGGSKQDVWALRSELSWARRLLGRVCVCVLYRIRGVYTSAAIKGPFTKYRDSVCAAWQWLLPKQRAIRATTRNLMAAAPTPQCSISIRINRVTHISRARAHTHAQVTTTTIVHTNGLHGHSFGST